MQDIFYQNHLGEKINLTEWPIMIQNEGDLLRVERAFRAINEGSTRERVTRWESLPRDIDLKLSIICDSEEALHAAVDRMRQVFDPDVAENVPGRFLWGESYLTAYVFAREPEDYDPDMYASDYTITAHLTRGLWTTERRYSFLPLTEGSVRYLVDVDGKYIVDVNGAYLVFPDKAGIQKDAWHGYPYRYNYTYAAGNLALVAQNDAAGASAFRLTIFGPASRPKITVNGKDYQVRVELAEGDQLVVDSRRRTVSLIWEDGTVEDVFRRRSAGMFQPLPAGRLTLARNGDFGFDLTVIEERGEPKWK